MSTETLRAWALGLLAAFISGAATFAAGLTLDPSQFSLIWKLALLDGAKAAAAYLKQSPLPCKCAVAAKKEGV